MSFTHLHCHSTYSLLKALPKIDDLIARAQKEGMNALALTDYANMYGIIEFYQKAHKAGIKPIIGVEVNVAPNGRFSKTGAADEQTFSLTLLAETTIGYKNLIRIVSSSHIEGYYHKPRIDFDLLKEFHSGIIALSGTIHGEIPQKIVKGDERGVNEAIQRYVDIFGKQHFFFEVQDHPKRAGQDEVNLKLLELGKELSIPVVATADIHYMEPEDASAHDVLVCVGEARKVYETDRYSMMDDDYSFRSVSQMEESWKDHPEVLENAEKIAERCNVEIEFGNNILPHFEVPVNFTTESYLRHKCLEGVVQRYGGALSENNEWEIDETKILIHSDYGDFKKSDILSRLEYELSVITSTGFPSYFLIVADFINWAKDQGIQVGPGRGSAAGSLVAFVLKITNIDPLKYDLLFERFLNPERISMPDIDIDFADTRRDEVLEYVENKYGSEQVGQIITFGTMAAKAAVRDVGRALGIEYLYCDRVSKMIPFGMNLHDALEEIDELKKEMQMNPDCRELIKYAQKVEGVCRHTSTHACGVLITPEPLYNYTPIQYAAQGDESIVSQYSLNPVESLGLLKMDFLGLSNMTLIENTLETIEKIHGTRLDMDTLPLNDQKTYELLQKGETTGVFQLESNGMKRYLKQLKPSNFEDIIAMVALYRPGPMELIPEYISNKHGITQPSYLHPKLESILEPTYGVAVYQEQLMKIAQELAGFTLGEADILRKAVGKKIKELLQEQKQKFVKGCVDNDVDKKIAEQVFAFIEPFAGYGFNRSHAACYALIAYYTAYLKANYPAEFMASLLTSDLHSIDRVSLEVQECTAMGIEVLPPDVNESFTRFSVVAESLRTDKPRIHFGLGAIKNVGEGAAKAIIRDRKENGKYTSLQNFLDRVSAKEMNKKSLECLIRSGALDSLGDRSQLYANLENLLHYSKSVHAHSENGQNSLFGDDGVRGVLDLEEAPLLEKRVQLEWEKELLGLYLSDHPFKEIQDKLTGYVTPSVEILQFPDKKQVRFAGMVSRVKKIQTKKGDPMAFAALDDSFGSVEVIVFPSVYPESADVWVEGTPLMVKGTVTERDGVKQVICDEVKALGNNNIDDFLRTLEPLDKKKVEHKGETLCVFFEGVVTAATIRQLNAILARSKGEKPVCFGVPLEEKRYRRIKTNFSVNADDPGLHRELMGVKGVSFVKMI